MEVQKAQGGGSITGRSRLSSCWVVQELIYIPRLSTSLRFPQDLATAKSEKIIALVSLGVRAQSEQVIGPSTSISAFLLCMMR